MKRRMFISAALLAAGALSSLAQSSVRSSDGGEVKLISDEDAVAVLGAPQNYEVGSFEIELKGGLANSLIEPPKDYKNYAQLALGVECRRNMNDGHWAFGGQLGFAGTMSMHKDVNAAQGVDLSRAELRGGFYIGPVAEYEWNRGADFSPFAGVGAGLMAGYTSGMYFMPKVGAEISRFVRCGFSAMLNPAGCASINLDFGIVFGGYRK